MAIRVTLGNPSQITARVPRDVPDTKLNITRATYQKLGSLVKNKTLVDDYDNGILPEEYVRVLDELNNLFLKKTYDILHGNLVIADGIEELDEYLGTLGIDDNYRYSKDFINIPSWIESEEPAIMRILTDETDDTYLTDGTDVLVIYNNN